MDDALSDYLEQMIYADFLEAVTAIANGGDRTATFRRHERHCAPLRRMLADQEERSRISARGAALQSRLHGGSAGVTVLRAGHPSSAPADRRP